MLILLFVAGVTAIRIVPKSQFGSLVNVPLNGPCVLNNEHAYKCTAAGYYETVQCDDAGCVCVDARNGAAAEGTRTEDGKKAPQCSQCHNYLKTQFANGEPEKNSFVPRCDREMGDFEKLQCTGEFCFCVDPQSGKEIAGTKKKREGNFILRCEDKSVVSTSVSTKGDGQVLPVGRDYCRLDRDPGHSCNSKASKVMYYFDHTTFDCLAFEHKGCGGNDNRFYSRLDCEATCLLNDFVACSGLSTPAKNKNGKFVICGGSLPDAPRGRETQTCPNDYTCVMGPFFGFCCPQATETKYAKAYRPSCPGGYPAQVRRRDGKSDTLLGKTCDDHFCPKGYHCVQSDPFAHCCQ